MIDEAEDTLTIHSLVDVVHAAGGDVNSGNIFSSVRITVVAGSATCTGGTGTGTVGDPYQGVTSCTLPFGSRLLTLPFSHYTVQAADFALPGHALQDSASLGWHDLCDDPAGTGNSNCNPDPPDVGAASQSLIEQLPSQTATDIHNAQHLVVTAVAAGSVVHDFVTVTGQPNRPIPTGNVTIDWFTNGECAGEGPAANSGNVALDGTGHADASGFAQGPLATGFYSFRAHYLGDATYSDSDGPCEPLQVVDANIQISPNGVNRVGQTHTFTAHVNVDDGTGPVNAPDGTQISFTIDSGPGAFTSANPCTIGGGTGSCTINLSSAVTGVTTVSAHTMVSVSGVSLARDTNGAGGNSGPATKRWVNAKISIAPNATNPVGKPHTFTATLQKDIGDGNGFVAAAGEAMTITMTPANGANPVPAGPFNCTTNAAGQCQATFTSATAGTVTAHASSTLSVAGSAAFTVQTDGQAGNSGDAVKLFADDTVRTDVHNGVHAVILTAVAGTIVHDNVQVAKAAGTPASVPNPTGSVIFHRYATINCTGAAVNQTVALTPGSPSTAESDNFAPTADISYQAEYLGDANYPAHTGACEPLTVTPQPQPAIAIVKNPKSQTVAIGGTATFSITVTNTGNVTLTDVHVVDPLSPNCIRTKADIPALASMAPGAAVTYSCTRPNVPKGGFDNVATAIGTPPTGPDVTASDTAPVKTKALVPKKIVKKKKPKIVSHKKPKATG